MNDLRKAAEMALEFVSWFASQDHSIRPKHKAPEIAEALRQALAHEALDRMVAENQRLGLYDDGLQTAIETGTKAWADVLDASEWVDELRGNEVQCKTHPDAPHGFDRNASHNADRYVCECEGWEPVDNVYMSEKRVHKTDKSIHEPVYAFRRKGLDDFCTCDKRRYDELADKPNLFEVALFYTAPPKREWVGLTDEDLSVCDEDGVLLARYWEAKLKEKNT